MKSGQVFKLDTAALDASAKFYKVTADSIREKAPEGSEWAISKSKVQSAVTQLEVRGSRLVNGKVQRGRPRKFPRHVVARLLGESDDASLANPVEVLEPAPGTAPSESDDTDTTEDLTAQASEALATEADESEESEVVETTEAPQDASW